MNMTFERMHIVGLYKTIDNPDIPMVRFDGDYWVSMGDNCMHILTSVIEYPTDNELLVLDTVSLVPIMEG